MAERGSTIHVELPAHQPSDLISGLRDPSIDEHTLLEREVIKAAKEFFTNFTWTNTPASDEALEWLMLSVEALTDFEDNRPPK